jgi:4-hydroxyacetophenone monooxygenase
MANHPELLQASDDVIDDAVNFADPMVLRGLVYQLTGDENLVAMPLRNIAKGNADFEVLHGRDNVALVRSRAAEFLKRYRDAGAGVLKIGPAERLPLSIRLTTGLDLPDSEIAMWMEKLAIDPYARGLKWKTEPAPSQRQGFSVAVIGAGMGGLNAAVLLKEAGIPFFVLEKNDDVGGTWYENRYPGARVDSASRTYTHSFGAEFIHPYAFSPRTINQAYFEWIADKYAVRDSITFNTEVTLMAWDEAVGMWEITSRGPQGEKIWRANAVITAVGFLSRPNMPAIPGMADFTGQAFHTARWPEGLDLAGKRVAVIGTGATGYQTIPEIAKLAGQLHVFQRTPGWCFDVQGYLAPHPPQVNWLDRNIPFHLNFARLRASSFSAPQRLAKVLQADPAYSGDPDARSERNKIMRDERIAFIRAKLASRPELAEKMIPPYPPMASRHILVDVHDNVYTALTRDNVTLVTERIERITATGIVTGAGEIPVDIIVYATGFRANEFLWPLQIRGRDGAQPGHLWQKDGPRAYLGTMLPGFPNFFMVYGPNSNNFGGMQIVDFEELSVRFALECIGGLITHKRRVVDVTRGGYERYNGELDRCEARMLYADPRVNSYYRNRQGRSAVNNPIDIRRIWSWTRDPSGTPGASADSCIEPYFGKDLVVA